jgi:hypothetical protein
MTPGFLVTAAISQLRSPMLCAWANRPERRAHFETLARLVIDGGNLPPFEMRAAVRREIAEAYDRHIAALKERP